MHSVSIQAQKRLIIDAGQLNFTNSDLVIYEFCVATIGAGVHACHLVVHLVCCAGGPVTVSNPTNAHESSLWTNYASVTVLNSLHIYINVSSLDCVLRMLLCGDSCFAGVAVREHGQIQHDQLARAQHHGSLCAHLISCLAATDCQPAAAWHDRVVAVDGELELSL